MVDKSPTIERGSLMSKRHIALRIIYMVAMPVVLTLTLTVNAGQITVEMAMATTCTMVRVTMEQKEAASEKLRFVMHLATKLLDRIRAAHAMLEVLMSQCQATEVLWYATEFMRPLRRVSNKKSPTSGRPLPTLERCCNDPISPQ
ncbi:unnamed protein product [Nippostrongylus brasiliensis]|uniref:Secreted protein n=1 Tax=Nippostrongylus brasiliensis TaxID=27835 RepID=A0A0N4YTD3_NIPBR|nr:hypothetical protein Q1695_000038 [Nippostrongylus brasiliensis]VDL84243.1 unnamed protein product [Nippostrongylus brasiliensis]